MSTNKQPKPESVLGDLIPEEQVAKELRKTTRTLRAWRRRGRGPDFTPIGRDIYYSRATVQKWRASQEQTAAPRRRRGAR
jgi:hypothetical protein